MLYDYICDKTKEVIKREFSIHGEIPAKIIENGKEYRRDYGSGRIPAIHIPLHWGSGENPIRCDKSPSGKKHFW